MSIIVCHIKHLEHLKAIVSVGYPPRLTICEVSSVQSEDFVHKWVFCIFFSFFRLFFFIKYRYFSHFSPIYYIKRDFFYFLFCESCLKVIMNVPNPFFGIIQPFDSQNIPKMAKNLIFTTIDDLKRGATSGILTFFQLF